MHHHIHDARRRLGKDVISQLAADYEAGQPTTALMATYGLGKGTVLALLNEAGVQRRGQGHKNIDLDDAAKKYDEGLSLGQLAAFYDCNAETVRQALKAPASFCVRGTAGHPLVPSQLEYRLSQTSSIRLF